MFNNKFTQQRTTLDSFMSNQTHPNQTKQIATNEVEQNSNAQEKILCPHCRRTATNGIKCKGICVADNDY